LWLLGSLDIRFDQLTVNVSWTLWVTVVLPDVIVPVTFSR
jgi:hypothetical protein